MKIGTPLVAGVFVQLESLQILFIDWRVLPTVLPLTSLSANMKRFCAARSEKLNVCPGQIIIELPESGESFQSTIENPNQGKGSSAGWPGL